MGAVPAWSATTVAPAQLSRNSANPLPVSSSPCLPVSSVLVFKRQPTHPPLRHADQRRAEGGGVDACADGEAGAPLLDLAGGHGVQVDQQIVQPSRPGEPGGVGRVQHVLRALEQALGVGCGEVLHKALGADPGPAAEEALKVVTRSTPPGRPPRPDPAGPGSWPPNRRWPGRSTHSPPRPG